MNRWRILLRRLPLALALSSLALSSAGCLVAAAGAAAGAGAYAYYQGNVTETYAAEFGQAYQATKRSLTELAMPVRHESHDGLTGTIESSIEDGTHVTISLEEKPRILATDGHQTEVTIRVGMLGDQKVSDKLQQHIRTHLTTGAAPGVSSPNRLPPIQASPPPVQQTGSSTPAPQSAPGWKPASSATPP